MTNMMLGRNSWEWENKVQCIKKVKFLIKDKFGKGQICRTQELPMGSPKAMQKQKWEY